MTFPKLCNQRKKGWNGYRYCGKPAKWKDASMLFCADCYNDLKPDRRLVLDKL